MHRTATLATVALLLSACEPLLGGEDASYSQVEIADAAAAAAQGDALVAGGGVLMALDRGYDLETVVEAIDEGRFETSNGSVRHERTGDVVAPTGDGRGVIADKPPLAPLSDARGSATVDAPAAGARGYSRSFAADTGDILLHDLLSTMAGTFNRIDFGDDTVGDLLADPDRADLPARWQGLTETEVRDRTALIAITGLAASGYSAEQIVWVIISGTLVRCLPFGNVDGQPCTIPGEEPEGESSPIFAGAGDLDQDGTGNAGTHGTGSEATDSSAGGASGDYRGSADVALGDFTGDLVLANAFFTVLETSVNGQAEIGIQAELYRDGSRALGCQYLLIEFEDVPRVEGSAPTYSGVMTIYRPETIYDHECGETFQGVGGFEYERDITFTVDNGVLTGRSDDLGWTFSATER